MDDGSKVILAIILSIVAFGVATLIIRWVFDIEKIVENLQLQTYNIRVLMRINSKLAEKNGLTKEEIDQIEKDALNYIKK
jgi:hypothetical protein